MTRLPLRRATRSDAAAVRALTRSAYAKWVPLIGREPLPMTADYDRAVVEHLIDLYEVEGELLALIEMVPQPAHLLIANLAVRPDRQGSGIGRALLAHAEDLARSLSLPELRLYTNAKLVTNLAFYARRGFRETSRERLAAGGELVHMSKPLAA